MTWQATWAERMPGFASANRILEIGAGAFETTVALARKYPDKAIFGLDFVLSDHALSVLKEAPKNLTVIKHDARDMNLFSDQYFDFVFSVAVMEHIHELEAHLKEVHRILAPAGRFCFQEGPFWSCSMGHHYQHWSDQCPIPPYAHLYMPRAELSEYLSSHGIASERRDWILHCIYDRGDLSRLSRTETKSIISRSSFRIEKWDEIEDEKFDEELAARVLGNNLYSIDASDFYVKSVNACLAPSVT